MAAKNIVNTVKCDVTYQSAKDKTAEAYGEKSQREYNITLSPSSSSSS